MMKISEADLAKLKGHTVVGSVSGGKDSAATCGEWGFCES